MEKETIFNHLSRLKKAEILSYWDAVWETMTEMQRLTVFGKLNERLVIKSLTPIEHFEAVEFFCNDSINKKYYAPFSMNSKNYHIIPEKTNIWFDTISGLLDRTCEWAKKGEKEIALKSFKLLFELIKIMENGGDIVFAHEYGDWMIITRNDYNKMYESLEAH